MIETASLIVVNLLIAATIGMIIGYLIGKNSGNSYKPSKKIDNLNNSGSNKSRSSVNPIFRKNSNVDNKPLILSSPRPSGKDKLTKIKGIDLKIEKGLNNLGIFHFNQIAAWSNNNCDWIEEFLSLPGYVKNNQWIEQAQILEQGKETAYSKEVENKDEEAK